MLVVVILSVIPAPIWLVLRIPLWWRLAPRLCHGATIGRLVYK
jgi:hypothetical protein